MRQGDILSESDQLSEGKWLDRKEVITRIRGIIYATNNTKSGFFGENSHIIRGMLSCVRDNLNKILSIPQETVSNEDFDDGSANGENISAEKPHWTQNPRYQITRLLQFLREMLERGEEKLENVLQKLADYAKKEGIPADRLQSKPVQYAITLVNDVRLSEMVRAYVESFNQEEETGDTKEQS